MSRRALTPIADPVRVRPQNENTDILLGDAKASCDALQSALTEALA